MADSRTTETSQVVVVFYSTCTNRQVNTVQHLVVNAVQYSYRSIGIKWERNGSLWLRSKKFRPIKP